MTTTTQEQLEGLGTYRFGWADSDVSGASARRGLSEEVVRDISARKNEPEWMLDLRLKGLKYFGRKPLPTWGADLSEIDFDNIKYFVRSTEKQAASWDELPADIKNTYDRLGIPEAEKQRLIAGVAAQYESEVVYHKIREDLEEKGVIFLDTDTALKEHPDLFKEYFGTVIPAGDNKFAALNTAVWSGGSFIYVPKGVRVEIPLQAYFRINTENMGQFERTMIIAEPGSYVHYVEGCHCAGSMVRVRDGEKPIEEIEEGHEVLTHRGRFRRVREPMRRKFSGPIYHIKFQGEGYRSLAVTPGHPFLIARRRRDREHNGSFEQQWLTAQELHKGDYVAVPAKIDVETEPQLVVESEVSIGHGRYAAVAERVGVIVDDKMARVIEGAFDANHWEYDYSGQRAGRSLRFSSVRAARFFAQNFGRTTHELRIPDWVFSLHERDRAAFVRGLYDGEGSYDVGLDLYRINQTNQQVAQRLRELLLSLGIRASLSVSHWPLPRRPMWQVAICKADHPLFERLVLGREPRPRRANHAQAVLADGYLWMPISSIEQIHADCEVFNMSVEEDESYVCEGVVSHNCTAPTYSSSSLHSAVVELVAQPGARIRYTTVQNWSTNVFNLVTKRAVAYEDATVEWVDCNLGSRLTTKFPSVYLLGERAHGEILSIAFAGKGQHQDAGGKIIHAAPNTTSNVFAKSICKDGGRGSYRGLLEVAKGAHGAKSKVVCDALLLDEHSRSDTYPTIRIGEDDVNVGHEATVSKVGEDQRFYLMSHGIPEEEASKLIVNGFIEPITKELPMEYAVEMNRLIELQMEGSIG